MTLLQSGGHLYHGQQSLRYVGRLQDHGTNLTCTVVQLDHLGTVLYSSTISLQLEVSELVIYSQGSGVLEERIGIISGIILAVIFIILIFILTALLLTRRRKKVKPEKKPGLKIKLLTQVPKYESVNGEKGSDEMLAPIWRPAGRRTNVSSDPRNPTKKHSRLFLRWRLCRPSVSSTLTTWRSTSTSTSRSSRGAATRPAMPGSQHTRLPLSISAGG